MGIILKVSANGDSLWYREYEYDTCQKNQDYLRDIKPTSDGGFIAAGFFIPTTGSPCNDTGTQDMWVMKLDSCGCVFAGCDSACAGLVGIEEFSVSGLEFRVFPNPTSGKITLQVNLPQNSNTRITVYNVLGELVYDQPFINRQIDLSYLPGGMYFLHIAQGQTTLREKIIKL